MMKDNNFTIAAYQGFIDDGKLMGSRCTKCGAMFLPLKPICDQCQEASMELLQMSGRGKIVAYSVIMIGPQKMIEEGFDRQNPYCSGIVELDEGIRIPARIAGVDIAKPIKETIGSPCRLEFTPNSNKPGILFFKILNELS